MKVEVTDIRDGDVVLVCARPLLRRLMVYDHAAISWVRNGKVFTVEAGATRVRAWAGLTHWRRPFDVFRPDGATVEDGAKAVDAALCRLGEPYAFGDLLPIVVRIIRARLRRGRVGVAAVVCTGLVAQAWQVAGFDLCPGNPNPTPDELAEALTELAKVAEEITGRLTGSAE